MNKIIETSFGTLADPHRIAKGSAKTECSNLIDSRNTPLRLQKNAPLLNTLLVIVKPSNRQTVPKQAIKTLNQT